MLSFRCLLFFLLVLTFLGCWFVLVSHATYWHLKTCWSMKHRNHVNINNYRLATISPFLTYLYLVRTPLISLLLKATYLYYINSVGRDILPIATYLLIARWPTTQKSHINREVVWMLNFVLKLKPTFFLDW
jgi:predicted neutral ceramidase superfamily lipid hydrolase